MIDYKYSFVINEIENNQYALVMNCWIAGEDGNRVDVKSDIKTNLQLTECFELMQQFVIAE
jgi:hypothetical protein